MTRDGPPRAMAISGLDPSGGAGLIADVRTFHQFGLVATGVATTITVQNAQRFQASHPVDAKIVDAQIDAVCADSKLDAVKVGALGSAAMVTCVAKWLERLAPVRVVDPVFGASSGGQLLDDGARALFRSRVLPLATLLTPNAREASWLSDEKVPTTPEMAVRCAEVMLVQGAIAVLVTGGHFEAAHRGTDVLVTERDTTVFEATVESKGAFEGEVHGTGCALSSAIASLLAHGVEMKTAVRDAKTWVASGCRAPVRFSGPNASVNHLADLPTER